MDESSRQSDKSVSSPETAATYRCVCGELILLHQGPVKCSSCSRRYASDVLRKATAETTLFRTNVRGEETTLARETVQEDPFVGRRLGHFQLLRRIGGGGMGTVYRALDESLQRYVALKMISKPESDTAQAVLERLFQEARAQARVNHPHVAHIYYVGIEEEIPFLAMELVGDETLAGRLCKGPLPFRDIIRFGLQMTEALAHAAQFDIVHGDVKPSNVLLVDADSVKISDFGLASRLSETAGQSKSPAGTPAYMPPEVIQGREVDHRGDMYSLGVTLFEMTFGYSPYRSSTGDVSEQLRLHCEAPVQFPESWPSELPPTWRDVLAKLLCKNPDERYNEFGGLIRDLQRHQPVTLPNASPLLRGLAWLFDGFLISSPLVIISLIFSADPRTIFPLLRIVMEGAIALGFGWLQARWGTTPGNVCSRSALSTSTG